MRPILSAATGFLLIAGQAALAQTAPSAANSRLRIAAS